MNAIAENWNLADVFKVRADDDSGFELMLEVYEISGESALAKWAIMFPFSSSALVWFGNDLNALKARVEKVVKGFTNDDPKDIEMRRYMGTTLDLNPPVAML